MTAPLARMRGIVKRFGPVQALGGADFTLDPGEIHAVLGENGAGKSTLMHVLFGMLEPEAGAIEVAGAAVSFASPREAMAAGIGMVHQHFTQVPAMSVAEHLALGREGLRFDRAAAALTVGRIAGETGLALDPAALAGDLPVSLRQRLEIVKALARDVRLLILDEPTSVLAPREVDDLFASLRRLASRGVAVALITHKLREVASVADRVTVLRGGTTVLAGRAAEHSAESLARAMIGQSGAAAELEEALEVRPAGTEPRSLGTPMLEVANLVVRREDGSEAVRGVSFGVAEREIVGLAAVEGNGQRELLRALAGLVPFAGTIAMRTAGLVGFIPEDRQMEGLILDFDVADNLALGRRTSFWLHPAELRRRAAAAMSDFGIAAPSPREQVRRLSGGNQQRVVLARALADRPALLIAENPTRGLDLAATAAVHLRLRKAVDEGAAVLFHSTDLDEVLALADRVAVMRAGRLSWVERSSRSREAVGDLMLGVATA